MKKGYSFTGLIAVVILFFSGTILFAQGNDRNADPITAPHTEDFNDVTPPALPSGWNKIVIYGPSGAYVETTTSFNPNSPPNHAVINAPYHADPGGVLMLITPPIAEFEGHKIEFYAKGNFHTMDEFVVGTITDPADETTFTPVDTFALTTTYTSYILSLDNYANGDQYIAFYNPKVGDTGSRRLDIDDFYYYDAQIVPPPAQVVHPADGAVMVIPMTHLEWEAVTYPVNATGYTINFGTDYPPTNIEDGTDLGDTTVYVPEPQLEFNTTYYWEIIPYNEWGDAEETPIWSFTTGPDPTLVAPYAQDFNEPDPPDLPYGWRNLIIYGPAGARVGTTTSWDPNSPPQHVEIHAPDAADPDGTVMLITPPIEFFEGHEIRFYAKGNVLATDEVIVGTITNPLDANTFTPVETITITTVYPDVPFILSLDDYTTGDQYVAFSNPRVGDSGFRRITIDDFIYYDAQFAPEPARVVYPADDADMVFHTTRLEWAPPLAGPSLTGYKINFGTDYPPGNIEDGTDLGDTTVYIPEYFLEYNTTYYWEIVPYNEWGDAEETPIWSFTTGPDPTLTDPHAEDFNDPDPPDLPYGWREIVIFDRKGAFVETTTFYNPNSPPNHVQLRTTFQADPGGILMLITPPIYAFEGHEIQFYAYGHTGVDEVVVGTITHPEIAGTFTPVDTIAITGSYSVYTISLDEYANNGDQFIAFNHPRAVDAGYLSMFIDDFSYYSVDLPPFPATNVHPADEAEMVLPVTHLEWAPHPYGPEVTGYKINFGTDYPPGNIEDGTDIGYTTRYFPDPFLDVFTTYYWQIVPYNDHGDAADTPIWSFTTGPDPTVTAPYVEDFNEPDPPALPYGWSSIVIYGPAGAHVRTVTTMLPNSPPNHIELRAPVDPDPEGILMLITPPLDTFEERAIEFMAKGSPLPMDEVVVGTITHPGDPTSFTPVDTISPIPYVYYDDVFVIDLDDYAMNGDQFIAFYHPQVHATGTRSIYIDDFVYKSTAAIPQLSVEPGELDFGDVFVGYADTMYITITNIGTETLEVTDITMDHNAFSVDITDFSLGEGESQIVEVTFEPDTDGVVTATLTIESNDPDSPHTVALQGEGILPPEIAVSPASFEETVAEGSQIVRTMTISNEGGSVLSFSLSTQEGVGDVILVNIQKERGKSAAMNLTGKPAGNELPKPITVIHDSKVESVDWIDFDIDTGDIEPDGEAEIEVTFDATHLSSGIYHADIVISSNDPAVPFMIVPVELVVELPLPDQVLLAYPEDMQTVNVPDDALEVQLGWHPSQPEVTNYQLDIAKDSDFSDIVYTDDAVSDTFYVFTGIEDNETYYWRVRAENETGWGTFSEVWSFTVIIVGVGDIEIPSEYTLLQNYPNPFNPSTIIRYGLPERSIVKLEIYNTLGQRVTILVNNELEAGYHEVEWYSGRIASGMYFYRLEATPVAPQANPSDRFVEIKTMMYIK